MIKMEQGSIPLPSQENCSFTILLSLTLVKNDDFNENKKDVIKCDLNIPLGKRGNSDFHYDEISLSTDGLARKL